MLKILNNDKFTTAQNRHFLVSLKTPILNTLPVRAKVINANLRTHIARQNQRNRASKIVCIPPETLFSYDVPFDS